MSDARPRRIGICGSYGSGNLGDEAILRSMVAQLRRTVEAEITVFSRDADDTLRRQNVDRAIPVRQLSSAQALDEVERLDLFILGGGGILYDPRRGDLSARGLARARGAGTGDGLRGRRRAVEPTAQALVRAALDGAVEVVTVRDHQSRRLLERIGVGRQVHVTADPALLAVEEPLRADEVLRKEGLAPTGRLVAMSLREPGPAAPELAIEHYHPLVAAVADLLIERLEAQVVFFPLEPRNDVPQSQAVVARMQHARRATVLMGDYSPGQVISLLRHFELALGMRLHFLIFAALADVPFVALPYATKVKGFLDRLQLDYPPIARTSAGQLAAIVLRAWDDRAALTARVRDALPRLQVSARRNHDLLLRLLGLAEPQPQPKPGI